MISVFSVRRTTHNTIVHRANSVQRAGWRPHKPTREGEGGQDKRRTTRSPYVCFEVIRSLSIASYFLAGAMSASLVACGSQERSAPTDSTRPLEASVPGQRPIYDSGPPVSDASIRPKGLVNRPDGADVVAPCAADGRWIVQTVFSHLKPTTQDVEAFVIDLDRRSVVARTGMYLQWEAPGGRLGFYFVTMIDPTQLPGSPECAALSRYGIVSLQKGDGGYLAALPTSSNATGALESCRTRVVWSGPTPTDVTGFLWDVEGSWLLGPFEVMTSESGIYSFDTSSVPECTSKRLVALTVFSSDNVVQGISALTQFDSGS